MVLENYLRKKMEDKDILLMTHIVLGYPSMKESFEIIEEMVEAGVDLMELQIPFSEPLADGPTIVHANHKALESGSKVSECLSFAAEAARRFDIPFLIMSYYNILYKYGTKLFVKYMSENKLKGAIVPDLPPEEGEEYLSSMNSYGLCPILLFSPTTPPERMNLISDSSKGFVYCVSRKGVTGQKTNFSEELTDYLLKCRISTKLPIAVGFGIKQKNDVEFLKGKADIAVIGTETIKVFENGGVSSVGEFIRGFK
jgi:tryptophan synthase alpha chain